jgi:CubicO group peptidase (beta-lactamase class C family)
MKNPLYPVFCYNLLLLCFFFASNALAHNGKTAVAYPVKNIRIDGDLSDWAATKRYPLALTPSDTKPKNAEDFSGFFMIGYNLIDKSFYVAIEVTDNDYVSDTTKRVAWNTQDAVELYLDISHLTEGSGVTSYIYSETHKHINSNKWDAASKSARWENVEVKIKRDGIKRVYEWKFIIGDALQPGRSIGFDMNAFDKDADSFSWNAWGGGEMKFRNSTALGDVIIMRENELPGTVAGQVKMSNATTEKISAKLWFTSVTAPQMWVTALVDSLGNYSTQLPKGTYSVALSEKYIPSGKKVYVISTPSLANISVKANNNLRVPVINATVSEAPDLIPEKGKGVLQTFNNQSPAAIDRFIETYQKYYKIPGISLALIKDGKVVYHKVYGVKNSITREPVNDSTLFEAASITKPVFGYAVQRLAERGVIDLDKPLYQYLPFKDIEDDERYKLITGRHVLTHRTGFPNWREGKLVINFTPGTKFGYSGEGMQYLQAVIEKITGKGIEQVLKEEVLDPLDMHHTFFSKNDRLMKLVSMGHFDNIPSSDDPTPKPGMAYSMHTEALEFTNFMFQLLNQKGLSAATYSNMLREHSQYNYEPGDEKPKYKEYMGESLAIRESPFGLVFGHGGNNGDFRCTFEVYKDLKMGYALFTNSSTAYPLIEKLGAFLVEGKE